MPNYNQPRAVYAGVDLHARSMLRYRLVRTERFLRRDVQHFSGKGNAATQSLHGNMPGPDLVRLFGAAQYAERDTAMRTIPALRERQSPDARGLETNYANIVSRCRPRPLCFYSSRRGHKTVRPLDASLRPSNLADSYRGSDTFKECRFLPVAASHTSTVEPPP
jgi:hypothetical protein